MIKYSLDSILSDPKNKKFVGKCRSFFREDFMNDVYEFLARPANIDAMISASKNDNPALAGVINELEKLYSDKLSNFKKIQDKKKDNELKKPLDHFKQFVGMLIKEILLPYGYIDSGSQKSIPKSKKSKFEFRSATFFKYERTINEIYNKYFLNNHELLDIIKAINKPPLEYILNNEINPEVEDLDSSSQFKQRMKLIKTNTITKDEVIDNLETLISRELYIYGIVKSKKPKKELKINDRIIHAFEYIIDKNMKPQKTINDLEAEIKNYSENFRKFEDYECFICGKKLNHSDHFAEITAKFIHVDGIAWSELDDSSSILRYICKNCCEKSKELEGICSKITFEEAKNSFRNIGKIPYDSSAEIEKGKIALDNKNYTEAIRIFSSIIEKNDKDNYAYLGRAIAYWKNKQFDEAISDCNKYIEYQTDNYDCYIILGYCYKSKNEFEKAFNYFNKSINLNQTCPESYYGRGKVNEVLGKFEEAIADFSMAIQLNPDDKDFYNDRGIVYRRIEKFEEADADFRMVEKLCKKDKINSKNKKKNSNK